jgi:dTDP-4-dehydrorhamnose reductase
MSDQGTVLVLGGTGQIGHEMIRELAWLGQVAAPARHEADLENAGVVRDLIRRVKPSIVVNAAAYTAVDDAESNQAACTRLNAELPEILARECRRLGALLIHFSTDYVFDGTKRAPYVETDATNPLGVYGASKLAGEHAIADAGGAYLIFRTSWVYAARGRNFPLTMLRLSREREELRVVDGRVGAPTSAPAVAAGVSSVLRRLGDATDFRIVTEAATGLYHMTAAGSTTWFEFAKTILDDERFRDRRMCRSILPIATAEYPTPAARPAYSVLDNTKLAEAFGVRLPSWREQWRLVAGEIEEEAATVLPQMADEVAKRPGHHKNAP